MTADSVVVSAPCVTTDNAAWIHSVPDPCDVVLGFFAVGAGAIDARVRVASAGARAGAAAARGMVTVFFGGRKGEGGTKGRGEQGVRVAWKLDE